ncbi:hypothetical protein AXF19_04930 [Selenomonas sp. oral taxon 126]|uniref:flagellar filament capping protein FliD n=1 Tax=Selenomonas sp. oral taxon 126 TaxID=712528 RepID=UPI000807A1BE|nr:flagellar filament capping protein FliD [Selenomonas sp. oral taxon 126]ANR70384.1 hypothetical protein AXF19_04930 [Selenomonas sp. oral taxon 126]
MATISQMTGAARTIYSSLYANNSRMDATAALFGDQQTRKRGSSLYSAQYRGRESSAQELRSIMDIANQAASLRKTYAETSSKFYAEYDSNMKDLRKAAGKVSGTDFQLDKSDIKTNADGSKTYSDRLKNAISNVKDLVNEYNETSDFLRENKSLGKGVQQLTTEFSDTTYKTDSYAKMGITVDAKTGKMSVNESRLARALTDSPAQSEAILGKGGLAGRADRHAQYAQMSRSHVIPSMEQAIGSQLNYAANMLNGRSLPTMQRYSNILNLFSIYV